MEENEKQVWYAVLMDVAFLNPSVAAYIPKRLIKGTLEYDEELLQEYFLDEFHNEYLQIQEPFVLGNTLENAVGYLIKEDELAQKYGQSLFQNSKTAYFEEVSKKAHFGFYVYSDNGEETVQLLDVDFTKFKDCFIQFPELLTSQENISFDQLQESVQPAIQENVVENANQELTGVIVFTKDDMEEVLALEDGGAIKEKLQEVYFGLIDALQKHLHASYDTYFENTEKMDEEEIRRFFDLSYKSLNAENDLTNFRLKVQKFDENLDRLLSLLESSSSDISWNSFFIYRLSLVASEVSLIDTLSCAKETICSALKDEAKEIDRLALEYLNYLETTKVQVEQENSPSLLDTKLSVLKMKEYLDEIVIGQENAKKKVISTIIRNALTDDSLTKNTCLLIGPTGSGKTLLTRAISSYLDKPCVFVDSTQLTIQGYKGHDLEEFLAKLLDKANGDKKNAENGIIVFDEIDKKATNGGFELEGFAQGVLDMLLSFIEGTTYIFPYKGKNISFDTSHLTIFATGSFEKMVQKMRNERNDGYGRNKIGFGTVDSSLEEEICFPQIQPKDLKKYGVPSELIGRISSIVQLEGMDKQTLKRIMTDSKESVLLSEKRIFEKMGMELCWTDGYLEKVAEVALQEGTGARALKRIIEASVEEARLETNVLYFKGQNYKAVILHENTVMDNLDCQFVDLDGCFTSLRELRHQEEMGVSLKKMKKM